MLKYTNYFFNFIFKQEITSVSTHKITLNNFKISAYLKINFLTDENDGQRNTSPIEIYHNGNEDENISRSIYINQNF